MSDRVPMPIRSLMALSKGQPTVAALPIRSAGTTYTMAQEAAFLDDPALCSRTLGRHPVVVRLH